MDVQTLSPDAVKSFEIDIDGKQVTVKTGRMAKQASGSVEIYCGDTMLLVTATESKNVREGIDYFPLLVDYEEKLYAVGRIPGSFGRREGKAPDKAILISRLIDRPIRPLFQEGYRNDVQIVATVMSADQDNPTDTYAMLGASVALGLAGLPFNGPIGAVRVGRVAGKLVANPTYAQLDESDLDLVVAGTENSIMMVEAGAKFVTEKDVLNAIDFAHQHIKRQVEAQNKFLRQLGIEKKAFEAPAEITALKDLIREKTTEKLKESMQGVTDKSVRGALIDAAKQSVVDAIAELPEEHELKTVSSGKIAEYLELYEAELMRSQVLDTGKRADGRRCDEIRPITVEAGILPRTHGTGLFTRGTTQVLSIATLGIAGDAQRLDSIDPQTEKRYMHHYNFPGFSVGEVKPMRGPGRREIGHGALAERAIMPALPDLAEFPYTLRVVSEVIESNGSTSMASTCGSSLSLMDAGVPLKETIGGIAMGLILEGDRFAILSDIQGLEDFLGDMDFKVAGSKEGITALQMDIKIEGISLDIMRVALDQAKRGRNHIISKMEEVLPKARPELSKWAPRIITIHIHPEDIGTVIGPGGKMIRKIIEETGATIDIEDDGTVLIGSVEAAGGEAARDKILNLVKRIEVGQIYCGRVTRIIPMGCFVELLPGKEGMVHISQLENRRVEKVEDVVSIGQRVIVKVREIDDRNRVNLTMKGVSEEERAECEAKNPTI
ncbi:MAG TPA: polyribonucleotide nucleotidyltransferase [Candidatus Melainabacteria bacterium]|nr:polyribonucleotide nucleotidyltransferase [Candidatus Melainabacteria bacterium]